MIKRTYGRIEHKLATLSNSTYLFVVVTYGGIVREITLFTDLHFYCETSDFWKNFLKFFLKKTQCKDEPQKKFVFSGIVHYDGLTIATECLLIAFVGMVAVCATATPAPAVVTAASGARPSVLCI